MTKITTTLSDEKVKEAGLWFLENAIVTLSKGCIKIELKTPTEKWGGDRGILTDLIDHKIY